MVKPTKMRNRQIHKATHVVRSKQMSANLSKRLREKYGRRSIRIVEGDTVMIKRGEYAEVPGKIEKVFVGSGRIAIAGIKKEKAKGDKFDVPIHASNVLVTGLKLGDPRRREKIGAADEYEAEAIEETEADDAVVGGGGGGVIDTSAHAGTAAAATTAEPDTPTTGASGKSDGSMEADTAELDVEGNGEPGEVVTADAETGAESDNKTGGDGSGEESDGRVDNGGMDKQADAPRAGKTEPADAGRES